MAGSKKTSAGPMPQDPKSTPTAGCSGTGVGPRKDASGEKKPSKFTGTTDLEDIRGRLDLYTDNGSVRQPRHTPGLAMLDLIKHAGRLAEIFQHPGFGEFAARGMAISDADKARLSATLADCCLASVRMADVCSVNLGTAIKDRLPPSASKPAAAENETGERNEAEDGNKSTLGKRKRFTDIQLKALRDLAEKANWSMMSVPKVERDAFCEKHCITKDRLHNYFNNRKPKDLKKIRSGRDDDEQGEDDED